jgi:uncharacterized protein YraI
MMRRAIVVLVGLFISATSLLSAQDVRHVTSSVRRRADASVNSGVIATLPAGARVEVRACAAEWCWVEYGKQTAYVGEWYLTAAGLRVVYSCARTYVTASGATVVAPLYSPGDPLFTAAYRIVSHSSPREMTAA